MPQRVRKLIGTFIIVFGLITYALFAAAFGAMAFEGNMWAQIIYYPVAGIVWIFPVRYLMIWMNRPDPE